MNRWKIIEWDNEEEEESAESNRSDDENSYDSDESPRDRTYIREPVPYRHQEPRNRRNLSRLRPIALDASFLRQRETPLQKTIAELKNLWPAALIPIFLLIFWCWNYCYLSNLDGRQPLDLDYLEHWTKISAELPEDIKRAAESRKLSQLRSYEEAFGGSLVITDGAFLDGSHVEIVGYQWNTSLPLGKMWDSMNFNLYKWDLDAMLSVSCIFEKSSLSDGDSTPVAAQVLPANDYDWVNNGPQFRRYFVIICPIPRQSRKALRYLEASAGVPTLDISVLIQQKAPRTILEYSYPRLMIPLMPVRKHFMSFCTMIRDHAKYLPEWLTWHFEVAGFDHAYILDHFSKDNISEVLKPFIDDGLVTLIKAPLEIPDVPRWSAGRQALVQPAAFVSTMNRYRYQTEWLAIFDIDEFLWVQSSGSVLKNELKQIRERESHINSVTFHMEVFTGMVDQNEEQYHLVTQRFKHRTSRPSVLSKSMHFTRDVAHPDIHTAKNDWHPLFPVNQARVLHPSKYKFVTYNCQYWMEKDEVCPSWREARTRPPFVKDNMMDAHQMKLQAGLKKYNDRINGK